MLTKKKSENVVPIKLHHQLLEKLKFLFLGEKIYLSRLKQNFTIFVKNKTKIKPKI